MLFDCKKAYNDLAKLEPKAFLGLNIKANNVTFYWQVAPWHTSKTILKQGNTCIRKSL